jgi:hypothetical protein
LKAKQAVADDDHPLVRLELRNSHPVDLLDLTSALSAFGEAYQDYAVKAGFDETRGNTRLFVREIRTGSIIADLASYAEQASFVLKHIEIAAGFLTNLKELSDLFLGLPIPKREPPTRKEAEQLIRIVEPVAKDNAAQLFLQVHGEIHVHYHIDSQQGNAIQNSAERFLGPPLPTSEIRHDQLLVLHQVRDALRAKVGDQGIIEELSTNPTKLIFATEGAKKTILDVPHPFQKIFLVDVEVKRSAGRVVLYRVLVVKDSLDRGTEV